MADERVLAMLSDACLSAGAEAEFSRDLGAYLARHGVAPEDAAAILAAPPRLALYRRMIRANLTDVTYKLLPRTRARLNKLAHGAFDTEVARFLDEVAPRTHYLRDVPSELLAWATPRWRARADLPRYAVDLAQHELAEFAVGAAPTSPEPPPLTEVALDRPLVFCDARRLVHYAFAIHELAADVDDVAPPAERPTSLLAYRDAHHHVRFLELTPFAATLLDELARGDALGDSLTRTCAAHGIPLGSELLADVARLLADLGERGVLLGAHARPSGSG